MDKPKIIVFASGTAEGGGSGFKKLVEASRSGVLDAHIIGVVSNHERGGVWEKASALNIPFIHFGGKWNAAGYQSIARDTRADFFALSGWLKLVSGLNPQTNFNQKTVFNIHPGPLPDFGGPGLYGHHVHEAVIKAFREGKIKSSAVSMHFVTGEYDRGPVFFRAPVKIEDDDTPETLAERVNRCEHLYQAEITNLVVNGFIRWDGRSHHSVCPIFSSSKNFE